MDKSRSSNEYMFDIVRGIACASCNSATCDESDAFPMTSLRFLLNNDTDYVLNLSVNACSPLLSSSHLISLHF